MKYLVCGGAAESVWTEDSSDGPEPVNICMVGLTGYLALFYMVGNQLQYPANRFIWPDLSTGRISSIPVSSIPSYMALQETTYVTMCQADEAA